MPVYGNVGMSNSDSSICPLMKILQSKRGNPETVEARAEDHRKKKIGHLDEQEH